MYVLEVRAERHFDGEGQRQRDIQHYSFSFSPITFFLHTLTGPLLAAPLQSPLAPRLSKGFSANSCIILRWCVQFGNKSLVNINKSNYAKAMPFHKQVHEINTTKTIKAIILCYLFIQETSYANALHLALPSSFNTILC